LIKKEVMEVVSKDPNKISTMGKCDIEDQCTTQDALNDTKDHKIENMSSIMGIKFKQRNSAIRKCVRVQLIKNGKNLLTKYDGCLNYISGFSVVNASLYAFEEQEKAEDLTTSKTS